MFDIQSYMPFGHCFFWQSEILWTHVVSDGLMALWYFSIPIVFWVYIKKRQLEKRAYSAVNILFSAFFLFCGTAHLMSIWTMWQPYYFIEGLIKSLMAVTSLVCLISLWRLLPKALKIPTPAQLKSVNAELEKLNTSLESKIDQETKKSRDRAQELEGSNKRLQFLNKITFGREQRMIDLKNEINELCERLGEEKRYSLAKER